MLSSCMPDESSVDLPLLSCTAAPPSAEEATAAPWEGHRIPADTTAPRWNGMEWNGMEWRRKEEEEEGEGI
jgi:hypothetical protein